MTHLFPPAAVAIPSPANTGYRPGDMALLGLVMAALLVLSLIVIGFLVSRLWKGKSSLGNLCQVSVGRMFTLGMENSHLHSLNVHECKFLITFNNL